MLAKRCQIVRKEGIGFYLYFRGSSRRIDFVNAAVVRRLVALRESGVSIVLEQALIQDQWQILMWDPALDPLYQNRQRGPQMPKQTRTARTEAE
ncbi:hypothetical protein Tco_0494899 [Tanacetum coccineum]